MILILRYFIHRDSLTLVEISLISESAHKITASYVNNFNSNNNAVQTKCLCSDSQIILHTTKPIFASLFPINT